MKKYIAEEVQKLAESAMLKNELSLIKKNDYKKNFVKLIYNKLILLIQKKLVPCHFKNWLLRTTGMHIGHDVCVPQDINFDPYFPELIYLKDGCLVGGGCTFTTHEVKGKKLMLGKCVMEERTMISGGCTLEPGSTIARNSMLSLRTTLKGKTGLGELWSGKPAKLLKKFSVEEIDKFFKPSDGNYKQYYKDFKKQVKQFMKDPSKNYIKIYYNGKRLNAGNDWWRARNIARIFYNGIIIEVTRLLPHSWLKTLLLRMVGVKIGKNVYIGKGVIFDHIYCDSITVEDNVRIDDYSHIDGHEYTITQTVFGKVLIKKGAHLFHHTFVRTGAIIGENSIIKPYSLAQKQIPSNETWGGIPARRIK